MEEHLKNRDRLDADWEGINTYESEEAVPCEAAGRPENAKKNRAGCPIPCTSFLIIVNLWIRVCVMILLPQSHSHGRSLNEVLKHALNVVYSLRVFGLNFRSPCLNLIG